jgi:hypothetical protein
MRHQPNTSVTETVNGFGGCVASLDRPGVNTTGFADAEFALSGKMLEVLKEIAPRAKHAAVIHNPVQLPLITMCRPSRRWRLHLVWW